MQLAAAVDHNRLCMVPKKGKREGSRAGEKEEGKDAENKTYTGDKHATFCKMLCFGSSLVCRWNDVLLQCSISSDVWLTSRED